MADGSHKVNLIEQSTKDIHALRNRLFLLIVANLLIAALLISTLVLSIVSVPFILSAMSYKHHLSTLRVALNALNQN